MRLKIAVLFCLISSAGSSQNMDTIKVHFLYGSKPAKSHKDSERKWFGGMLGGHVGVEIENGKILNFGPNGKAHLFASKKDKNSSFSIHNHDQFYSLFGGQGHEMKYVIFAIPISSQEIEILDSVATSYLKETPYDYAFFGMRCGAAAYDLLSKTTLLKKHSVPKISRKIFYPRKLRKRLFKLSEKHNWQIIRNDGNERRKWESDWPN